MSDLPPLHELQRFEARRIARTQIKNAAYNPRKISGVARAKLEEILAQFGLVETLVWNARTGNLVSGHQRLKILDTLGDSPDYSLDVAVVDLDDAQEKALNIALNAKGAQGEYEMGELADLLNDLESQIEVDLKSLFVDEKELQKLLNGQSIAPLTTEPECATDKQNLANAQSMTLLFLNPNDAKITLQAIERAKAQFSLDGDKIDAVAIATICQQFLSQ